jgi:hypothetical protein
MSHQHHDRPLGAFLAELRRQEIPCILIGAMAAVEQGAPISTIDYDFWVKLPVRQYVRLLAIVQKQGGAIMARTLYELSDGTQVNAVFEPDGLRSFDAEWRGCRLGRLAGQPVRVLPIRRVIASKRAAGREKDLTVLPILRRTMRLGKRAAIGSRRTSRQ